MATFTNSATLTYNGGVTTSNVVTGELLEVLSATKTATRASFGDNSPITYVISMRNTGNAPITGVNISDDLGAFEYGATPTTLTPLDYVAGSVVYFVNGVLQTAPAVNAGPPLSITGLTIPAGGSAVIIYEATPNAFAPRGDAAAINNTATVTGDGISTPVVADASVTASVEPQLTISKALSPATVAENGQLTYTFNIFNYGNTAAETTDNVVLSDTFNPILNPITATMNGMPMTLNTDYTYNAATGEFNTVAGRITVPAATFVQDAATGAWTTTPGVTTITITGTV